MFGFTGKHTSSGNASMDGVTTPPPTVVMVLRSSAGFHLDREDSKPERSQNAGTPHQRTSPASTDPDATRLTELDYRGNQRSCRSTNYSRREWVSHCSTHTHTQTYTHFHIPTYVGTSIVPYITQLGPKHPVPNIPDPPPHPNLT